jgi:hypothetical protein
MYCLTILDKNYEGRLFFYSKELATQRQEKLLLKELNRWVSEDNQIQMGQIDVKTLQILVSSFIKTKYIYGSSEDEDIDTYYDNNKYEVFINLIHFEDA